MKTNTPHAAPAAHDIHWQCLLSRSDMPELFHAAFRSANFPGRDEQGSGCWRLFDEHDQLLYEVRDVRGVVPADAPKIVRDLIAWAFELFPEAFGKCGALYELPRRDARHDPLIHRKCA